MKFLWFSFSSSQTSGWSSQRLLRWIGWGQCKWSPAFKMWLYRTQSDTNLGFDLHWWLLADWPSEVHLSQLGVFGWCSQVGNIPNLSGVIIVIEVFLNNTYIKYPLLLNSNAGKWHSIGYLEHIYLPLHAPFLIKFYAWTDWTRNLEELDWNAGKQNSGGNWDGNSSRS